jgi:hypothetical protein
VISHFDNFYLSMLIVFTASGLQPSPVAGPFSIAAQRRMLQNTVGIHLVAVRPTMSSSETIPARGTREN